MVAADTGHEGFVFACMRVGGTLEIGRLVWALYSCHLRRSPLIVAGLSHRISQLNTMWLKLFLTVCAAFWFVQKQKNYGEGHSWNCISNSGVENFICSFYSL